MLSPRTTPLDGSYFYLLLVTLRVDSGINDCVQTRGASISGPTERRRRSKTLVVWGTKWLAMGCDEEHKRACQRDLKATTIRP